MFQKTKCFDTAQVKQKLQLQKLLKIKYEIIHESMNL